MTDYPIAPIAMRYVERALGEARVNVDIIDSRFIIRYMDPLWKKRYRDPVGKKCYRVFEGRTSPCPGCGVLRAIRTGQTVSYDAVLPKEKRRPIHVVSIPFRDERGVQFVAEVNIDISERKRSETELKTIESRFRAIADLAGDSIFIVDRSLRVTYVNTYAAARFRKSPDEIVGKRLADLFEPSDFAHMSKALRRVFATGKPVGTENRFIFPQGEAWLSNRLCPVKDEDGKMALVLGLSRDITSLKKAEEVLRRDKTALGRVARDKSEKLLEAQRKLDQAERLVEIGTLAASVAHELRNPLAAIRTAVFNIRRKTSDLSLETHMTNIERKIQESDQIINNLLLYGKIAMPHVALVDLCTLMDECVESAKQRFDGYAVSVRKNYQGPRIVKADPLQMKEVFDNILNNAYEAMPSRQGALDIGVEEERGGGMVISIKDTGVGIAEGDISRVHEPFFSTKRVGTGLGLPICHKIITLHGGSIGTKSTVGKGTTIKIRLPSGLEEKKDK